VIVATFRRREFKERRRRGKKRGARGRVRCRLVFQVGHSVKERRPEKKRRKGTHPVASFREKGEKKGGGEGHRGRKKGKKAKRRRVGLSNLLVLETPPEVSRVKGGGGGGKKDCRWKKREREEKQNRFRAWIRSLLPPHQPRLLMRWRSPPPKTGGGESGGKGNW